MHSPLGRERSSYNQLGISPKACLKTDSNILGQVGSSKNYPQDPAKSLPWAIVRADEEPETLISICVV